MAKDVLYYKKLAKYYDAINFKKDYLKESLLLKKFISKYRKSQGTDLLDIACGTGEHIKQLKNDFKCTGIDLSKEMLAVARKKVKQARFIRANMLSFNLSKKFDVITCLDQSISLLNGYDNLNKVIWNFSHHVKPGGVLIIEPWFQLSKFKEGLADMWLYDSKDLKVARANFSILKNENKSILKSHLLIAENNIGVSHYTIKQTLSLFQPNKILQILRKNGFEVKTVEKSLFLPGTDFYVAVKTL